MTTTTSHQLLLRIAVAVCPVCGQETRNPKFCSRSCAAKVNNVLAPKRRLGGICSVCSIPIPRRSRYCWEHRPNRPLDRSQPIGAVADGSDHPACRHARLRQDARRLYRSAFPYRCSRCGYDKHIEVCHKRPLTTFPLETPISVVNSLDNLVGLCPNCHWEFDHGLLQL
jgi:5-methylcytosine-specific restriction endonuclease McrA